ncbi:MAG: hypothetical protein U9R64_12235 [Pseudomonadota bacterium]|nr:hypothetical protein [Pseudomonadota bacterium]
MTIIASTAASAAEPFTPSWLKDATAPATFFLRAGDVIEREMFEAQLAGPKYRAGEVWPWEKQASLMAGLTTLAGEDAPQLIALAQTAASGQLEDKAEIALLEQATAIVAQHYAPYGALVEQEERRRAVLPVAAFCRYCVRADNVDAEIRRGIDGFIDPDCLRDMDPMALRAAGFEAYNRQYAATARKNSDAPSKSGADPKTSPSEEPSGTGGSLTGIDTP